MAENLDNFLNPEFGFTYPDLFDTSKLKDLHSAFLNYFEKSDNGKFTEFKHYSDSLGEGFTPLDISKVLIESAPFLSSFIGKLFQIDAHLDKLFYETKYEHDVMVFKKDFVQKEVLKKYKSADPESFNWDELNNFIDTLKQVAYSSYDFEKDEEKYTAKFVLELADLEKNYRWFYEGDKFAPENFEIPANVKSRAEEIINGLKSKDLLTDAPDLDNLRTILQKVKDWLFVKFYKDKNTKKWVSYFEPKKTDYDHLVDYSNPAPDIMDNPEDHFRQRDGFKLNDFPRTERQLLNQIDYCMYCHEREKDSCSKGLTDRMGNLQTNPLGNKLHGCPLEEKISEAHFLRKEGFPLAAFSLIMIDNPMCPGTGHRICNFCMKGCIFQKQEPVNIPMAESSILREILALPYGFEIYNLLTKWNPLNIHSPYPKPYNGKNILVVGLGPAGYTLAHYLLKEGFGVVAIEGLKVEPIFEEYTLNDKSKDVPQPVKYFFDEVYRPLNTRILQGFGGVSEYGITVRWDKNFLSALYLSLCRNKKFSYFDGVRFGGSMTIDDAWTFGFDHIALTTGAAKPTLINVKNNLIKGVRKSSDFLMQLQLTGAQKDNNFIDLQVQLPAVVIGGGLTAIDCSTELLAYYPVQVEKVLSRYEKITSSKDEKEFWEPYTNDQKKIIEKFFEHAKIIREEKQKAASENRQPDITSLLRDWGGVKLIYRKRLNDAPSYRENHEEIVEALEQGVQFMELLSPKEFVKNSDGAVEEVKFDKLDAVFDEEKSRYSFKSSSEVKTIPAKTVIIAAGTTANIIYEEEHPGTLELDKWGKYFKTFSAAKNNGSVELLPAEDSEFAFFTSYNNDGKLISFFGDSHPYYYGTVVTAMASAMKGLPKITELFSDEISQLDYSVDSVKKREEIYEYFSTMLETNLRVSVKDIKKLTDRYTELTVSAPLMADKFRRGQFYKIQTYEKFAGRINGDLLTTGNIPLYGCKVDSANGTISFVIDSEDPSRKILAHLKSGDPVFISGPAGSPIEIPENETILIAAEGYNVAAIVPIVKEFKDAGKKLLIISCFKNSVDAIKVSELEELTDNADQIIWCYTAGDEVLRGKNEDLTSKGDLVSSLKEYVAGNLGKKKIDLNDIQSALCMGSPVFLENLKDARFNGLAKYFGDIKMIGSVDSPMQCMMKGVCADCLQRLVDPSTGEEKFVYSCSEQFQDIEHIDFENLRERLDNSSPFSNVNVQYFDFVTDGKKLDAVK